MNPRPELETLRTYKAEVDEYLATPEDERTTAPIVGAEMFSALLDVVLALAAGPSAIITVPHGPYESIPDQDLVDYFETNGRSLHGKRKRWWRR